MSCATMSRQSLSVCETRQYIWFYYPAFSRDFKVNHCLFYFIYSCISYEKNVLNWCVTESVFARRNMLVQNISVRNILWCWLDISSFVYILVLNLSDSAAQAQQPTWNILDLTAWEQGIMLNLNVSLERWEVWAGMSGNSRDRYHRTAAISLKE